MFSELLSLFQKAFVRLRTAVMNPFRRVIRRTQQLSNANLITAKLINPINKKLREIFSFKPKAKEDYITIGSFWISRKVVYFLIVAICAGVFIYFTWFAGDVQETTTTTNVVTTTYYDYDDLKLAEFSGKANIKAANGSVVYTGDVADGMITGTGTLWNQDGILIYEGSFLNNQYSGVGTLYYPNGKVRYSGDFAENLFNGNGYYYSPEGNLLYTGSFENGTYNGEGIAYNEEGSLIYEGNFQSGNYHGNGVLYYANGIKKYEGEFYQGKEQGQGVSYSNTRKRLFTGLFARNEIHYESLLGITLEDALAMFGETPVIYYSEVDTVFLFEGAHVALKGDCMVQLLRNNTALSVDDDWYMPGEEADELTDDSIPTDTIVFDENGEGSQLGDGESKGTDENKTTTSVTTTKDADGNEVTTTTTTDTTSSTVQSTTMLDGTELPVLAAGDTYSAYYYLSSDEWQQAENLDKTQVTIEAVTAFSDDLDVSFLENTDMTAANGATNLIDCVAIDRIRRNEPTAFSNNSFEMTTKNKSYIYVSGINMAEAVYSEIYELEGVRYKLCYQMDNPDALKFMTLEVY